MAENPENENVEAEGAAEDAAAEAAEGAAAEGGEAQAAGDEAPAREPTKAELRGAKRHKEASSRPPRTPEERQAERDAARKAKAAARRRRRLQERERRRQQRGAVAPAQPAEKPQGRKKVRQGVVVSAKPDKTITVRIDTARRHPRYEKIVRSSVTLHAHDEANEAREGDTVRVIESRPLSRTKRWRLVEILERAR
jgi:small subunit ribosomal protein S17